MHYFNINKFELKPNAVLIDTDNTLYAYDQPHQLALSEVKKKVLQKLAISSEQFEKVFELSREEVKKNIPQQAASHSRLLYFKFFLESLGLGSHLMLALDLEQTYWRTFLKEATLFDDVKEFLDDLRILKIPVAVVTDLTTQIQFRKLIHFELDKFFDLVITSEEAGSDKPSDKPFKLAIQRLKPKGTNYWMIGDNCNSDIFGAKKSINATTIQKIHKGIKIGKEENQPDAYFRDFSELKILLESYK